MSDERELKLQLLKLADGNTERAQHMFDWLQAKPAEILEKPTGEWLWWHTTNEENYHGGVDTKEGALDDAREYHSVDDEPTGTEFRITVMEAIQRPLFVSDLIDFEDLVTNAVDGQWCENVGEDGDEITRHITKDQWADLSRRVLQAELAWRRDNKIEIKSWSFSDQRNEETVTVVSDGSSHVPIAALTPAPQAEGDALAEFMKRERAVKWMGGDCPFPIGTYVVMLHRDGTEQGRYITHSDDYSGDYAWGRSDFGHREDDIVAFIDPQLATTKQQKGDDSEPLGCFEPGSGDGEESDALAEFMKREGAVKWEGGPCPVGIGTHIEVLTRKTGVWPVIIKPEAPLLWEREGHDLDILAYRIISTPSEEAGKGEDAPEIPEGFKPWPPQDAWPLGSTIEYWWPDGHLVIEGADQTTLWSHAPAAYRVLPSEPAAEAKGEEVGFRDYTVYDTPTPDTITISASKQHAEESARAQSLPPLLPPEPPPAATPEQLEATGVIDGEAGWWGRKLMKERA